MLESHIFYYVFAKTFSGIKVLTISNGIWTSFSMGKSTDLLRYIPIEAIKQYSIKVKLNLCK
jgi:hypothetical protein